MNEHKISIEKLYKNLNSSENGLTTKEAEKRLKIYGLNVIKIKRDKPLIIKFFKQFTNFFAVLLIVGALLAFMAEYLSPGIGNLYIGMTLIIVVFLNSTFTFIQEHQSEKIQDSFKKMLPSTVEVIRDNKRQHILTSNLIPGDIIYLFEGDKVPADSRLIEHNSMKVDNSSITGESEPQLRHLECTHDNILESRNIVFSGTLVQSGNGKAIVYGTGHNTELGKIVELTKTTKEVETPLHKEIKYFIRVISTIAIIFGFTFFILGLFLGQGLIGSLIFGIGILVANVPEGLLPTVSLSLSMTAKKMAKKNALVKHLESVETLGSTTVICTDKTGTITENKMTVNTVMVNFVEENAYEKELEKNNSCSKLINAMVLCNNSRLENQTYVGDPTESSLMEFSKKYISEQKLIKKEKRVHELPFDSKTKRMITVNKSNDKLIAYMKGAPEVILEKCDKILINGIPKALSLKDKESIHNFYERFASRGERVLAFAYKYTQTELVIEENFIFIGLTGLIDPPRKEVPEAIAKCERAGIKVIMITGDYSLTAEAIARQIGIIYKSQKANIVTGFELEKMSDKELKNVLKKENLIFARTNPIQKLKIVQALQAMGEIVTVTGDGVNDAPALKNADIGVSMGRSGTDVAREASNMILLDDNFATIVTAVEEGRAIYENIRKFISYILTSNIPEIVPFIAFALFGIPLPLTVVLILLIDLGTDFVPAIGLGSEKLESDVMNKKPRPKDERLLTKHLLLKSYGLIGMLEAAAGFFSYFIILFSGGWEWSQQLSLTNPLYLKAVTAFFASIVICQVANVFICRTSRQSIFTSGFFTNRVILVGIITELVLLSMIVYLPVANTFLGTHPLTLTEICLPIPFAFLIFFVDEVRKFFLRRQNRFNM